MITNYQESIKKHLTLEEFTAKLELLKQRVKNEISEAEISEPIIVENKQYNFGSENVKCIGKSCVSSIKVNNEVVAHLHYFKSNSNDFFDFNIRP